MARVTSLPAALDAEHLRRFATDVLERLGVPTSDAALVAATYVDADLEGHGSHGITRLPFLARRLRAGLIARRATMTVLINRPAAALLDAGNALGPVAADRGMRIAVEKARLVGIGLCGVRGSNHMGALSFYVRRAADEGAIALAFTNTPPAMAPPGGRTPVLGTNPIAAAFPATGRAVVVDLATSQTARGRILQAAQAGSPIPAGWAADRDGAPTTDPVEALAGSLLPLGGAKGFALALVVEALAGVLPGAGVADEVTGTFADSDRPSNVGHCFLAIEPDGFGAGFAVRMGELAAQIRSVAPVDPAVPVRVPGDAPHALRTRRAGTGLALPPQVVAELNTLAEGLGAARLV